MAHEIKFNFAQYDELIKNACMDRMREAASVIQLNMILKVKKSYDNRRPPYKMRVDKATHKLVPTTEQIYTARDMDIMAKTIRVVEKRGLGLHAGPNVRVYAGNFKTWWAQQMEYGNGAWKGGAQPFMRPALAGSKAQVKTVLENGSGATNK
jgi:hypothetical protein